MARSKLVIILALGCILLLVLGLTQADGIRRSICVNRFYLGIIREKKIPAASEDDICSAFLPGDDEITWWQGYAAWKAGLADKAVQHWRDYPDLAVKRMTYLIHVEDYPLPEKAELLRLGLLASYGKESLVGKLCFNIVNELPLEESYDTIYRIWSNQPHSPNISASLAYLLTQYNPEGYLYQDLFLAAYQAAPHDPYILTYGFRIYLEGGTMPEDVLLDMLSTAEEIAGSDIVLLQNMAAVYQMVGNYEKAKIWNRAALHINPQDLKVNLRQLELAFLSDDEMQKIWIENILQGIEANPNQGVNFYQRLLAVLIAGKESDAAREAYCLGVTNGLETEMLLVESQRYLWSTFEPCE